MDVGVWDQRARISRLMVGCCSRELRLMRYCYIAACRGACAWIRDLCRGLVGLFIFLNFASEKKQIQYLWSYVDRLGGVFAPASMENRTCLVMSLSTRWFTPSV